jgi:hypothetical protein
MAAGNYDIFCDLGESFTQTFQYLNEDMNAINLQNYIIHFRVKSTSTTTDEYMFEAYSQEGLTQEGTIPFINTDTTEYGTIEKLTDGKFTVKLFNETIDSLKRGYYFYNIRLFGTDDSITSILKGRFVVQSEVE